MGVDKKKRIGKGKRDGEPGGLKTKLDKKVISIKRPKAQSQKTKENVDIAFEKRRLTKEEEKQQPPLRQCEKLKGAKAWKKKKHILDIPDVSKPLRDAVWRYIARKMNK